MAIGLASPKQHPRPNGARLPAAPRTRSSVPSDARLRPCERSCSSRSLRSRRSSSSSVCSVSSRSAGRTPAWSGSGHCRSAPRPPNACKPTSRSSRTLLGTRAGFTPGAGVPLGRHAKAPSSNSFLVLDSTVNEALSTFFSDATVLTYDEPALFQQGVRDLLAAHDADTRSARAGPVRNGCPRGIARDGRRLSQVSSRRSSTGSRPGRRRRRTRSSPRTSGRSRARATFSSVSPREASSSPCCSALRSRGR